MFSSHWEYSLILVNLGVVYSCDLCPFSSHREYFLITHKRKGTMANNKDYWFLFQGFFTGPNFYVPRFFSGPSGPTPPLTALKLSVNVLGPKVILLLRSFKIILLLSKKSTKYEHYF